MSRLVVGVDEAGRGPLAGPVVAAAVILDPERPVLGLADSKALDASERTRLSVLLQQQSLGWCVAVASPNEIDTINILQATMLAMRRALLGLLGAAAADGGRYGAVRVEVDGNRLPSLEGIEGIAEAVAIVKGDATQPAISAASILAKTARDRVMEQLDTRYPEYGFAIHKGYPTPAHLAALKAHGASSVHRRSFGPVKSAAR
jgi:ribonuclease HII